MHAQFDRAETLTDRTILLECLSAAADAAAGEDDGALGGPRARQLLELRVQTVRARRDVACLRVDRLTPS